MIFTRTSRKYKNILYARSDFRKLAEHQPDDLFCTESGKGTEADLLQSGRNLRSAEGRTQRDENPFCGAAHLFPAGLPKIRFHDLRHSFATLALQNGVDIKSVRAISSDRRSALWLATSERITISRMKQPANCVMRPANWGAAVSVLDLQIVPSSGLIGLSAAIQTKFVDCKIGKKTYSVAADIGGSWAGSALGAKGGAWAGAAIGSAILPGVGTAVGGIAGSLILGVAGSFAGSSLGKWVVDITEIGE